MNTALTDRQHRLLLDYSWANHARAIDDIDERGAGPKTAASATSSVGTSQAAVAVHHGVITGSPNAVAGTPQTACVCGQR